MPDTPALTPAQVIRLIRIVHDLWWMARRYADGRSSTAPSTVNQAIRDCEAMGIRLIPGNSWEPRYAADGMGLDDLAEGERAETVRFRESLQGLTRQALQLTTLVGDNVRWMAQHADDLEALASAHLDAPFGVQLLDEVLRLRAHLAQIRTETQTIFTEEDPHENA